MPICIAGRASSDTRFCRRGPLPINEAQASALLCAEQYLPFHHCRSAREHGIIFVEGLYESKCLLPLFYYAGGRIKTLTDLWRAEEQNPPLLESSTRKYVHTGRGSGEQPERHHQTTSITLGLLLITNGAPG